MELAGEVVIGVSPPRVWAALNDPEVLRKCIPGCEEVQQISPTETHTRVLLKMGPVRARFVGKIFMRDMRPDDGCTLDFEGSGGAAGFARGNSVVRLVADAGATRLHYSASASIGGKLGQIGGRMIDASAKQMADQFFNAFKASFETDVEPPGGVAGDSDVLTAIPIAHASRAPAFAAGASIPTAAAATTASTTSNAATVVTTEYVRVLWFVLGMGSTGFGVWLASRFGQ